MTVFVEITKLSHGHGGAGWELGTCLWCPATSTDGRDRYAIAREPKVDDRVYHLVGGIPGHPSNDRFLWGSSQVAVPYREVQEEPPLPGDWGGREAYYRIELKNLKRLEPSYPMQDFQTANRDLLLSEVQGRFRHYPFSSYGTGIRTAQGMYLAKPSQRLQQVFAEMFPELG